MLSLVIIDDSPDIRALMRLQFAGCADFEVCGLGATAEAAVEMADRLHPDVLLLDLSLPDMDGLEALPLIRQASPGTRVVVHSGHSAADLADRACEAGAAGYLEKSLRQGPLAQRLLQSLDLQSLA